MFPSDSALWQGGAERDERQPYHRLGHAQPLGYFRAVVDKQTRTDGYQRRAYHEHEDVLPERPLLYLLRRLRALRRAA